MKSIIKATVVSMGLSVMASAAWAQFAPNMDSSAVKAQVQKQLDEKASEQAIIAAAAQAQVSPELVIDAILALTPKARAADVVGLLSQQYKNNNAALAFLSKSAQNNQQLGLSADQVRQIIATNSGNAEFQLAGVPGIAATPGVNNLTSVNNLFNVNSPAAGTGSGTPASAN